MITKLFLVQCSMGKETLTFSYNWNNKLDCNSFTTIRLEWPEMYQVGMVKDVQLKGEDKGKAQIMAIKPFYLSQLNEFIARLDTGYGVEECTNIIRRMYPKVNFDTKRIYLILLSKLVT